MSCLILLKGPCKRGVLKETVTEEEMNARMGDPAGRQAQRDTATANLTNIDDDERARRYQLAGPYTTFQLTKMPVFIAFVPLIPQKNAQIGLKSG